MSPACVARIMALLVGVMLSGCAFHGDRPASSQPLRLELTRSAPGQITAEYRTQSAVDAIHFERELGDYRTERWRPIDSGFRWLKHSDGERIERIDGRSFDRIAFTMPIDYQALPKDYAPFSPFSDGSTLIYSGQFHACLAAPCKTPGPLPITVRAQGQIVGVNGVRRRNRAQLVSRDTGTNIFVGLLEPINADGFVAIIDPGLPIEMRRHLDRSLPQAMQHFAAIYGPLAFTPELYVSLDDTPEANGKKSTQGGTLPNQIFMHFDGENARQRVSSGTPFWLDWFFAHEAAHLFQQDKANGHASDDQAAWLHEGGADAIAALALAVRGDAERKYAQVREREAEAACARGLAATPLNRATADGKFDLHYQCGLVIWLALDQELRRTGVDGINGFNLAFFAKVRAGQSWSEATFLATAKELGASNTLLSQIGALSVGRYADPAEAVDQLGTGARRSLASLRTS
jgi:hypothetical protein